jgi:Cro/C1-type HTH DNA-binding domain
MTSQVDYQWRLRPLMAQHGIYTAAELAPHLAEHGVRLSASQVWRLVTCKPERLNLRTLRNGSSDSVSERWAVARPRSSRSLRRSRRRSLPRCLGSPRRAPASGTASPVASGPATPLGDRRRCLRSPLVVDRRRAPAPGFRDIAGLGRAPGKEHSLICGRRSPGEGGCFAPHAFAVGMLVIER